MFRNYVNEFSVEYNRKINAWANVIQEPLLFSVITCQRPILTSELHLTSNPFRQRFYLNESLSFFCSVGFHLQGSSIKYCTKTDDFQHDLPTCASKILRFHYFLFYLYNMQINTFINTMQIDKNCWVFNQHILNAYVD